MSRHDATTIETFDFQAGRMLAGKYRVLNRLGGGTEGEVYRVTEARTGIDRAAKIFYPHQNRNDRAARYYATKLERLRDCEIVIQYHHAEDVRHRGVPVTCLISELVDGEILSGFVARHPGQRLHHFEALHLLWALTDGLDQIHRAREYHGDIHEHNILVARAGIGFDVKLVDFHHHGPPNGYQMREDVIQLVRVFYNVLGGRSRYPGLPASVKSICCGLRSDLIARRFPTAGHLRRHLQSLEW
ncbi:MAG: protein kinase domain-containing protein [Planctomycetota bacterium]|jgi:RIO-like serine/threonine protein kinase